MCLNKCSEKSLESLNVLEKFLFFQATAHTKQKKKTEKIVRKTAYTLRTLLLAGTKFSEISELHKIR